MSTFPIPPFNEDPPGSTSQNDTIIIRDYLNGVVLPALNSLAERLAVLEGAPPSDLPVITITLAPEQVLAFLGIAVGQRFRLIGETPTDDVAIDGVRTG